MKELATINPRQTHHWQQSEQVQTKPKQTRDTLEEKRKWRWGEEQRCYAWVLSAICIWTRAGRPHPVFRLPVRDQFSLRHFLRSPDCTLIQYYPNRVIEYQTHIRNRYSSQRTRDNEPRNGKLELLRSSSSYSTYYKTGQIPPYHFSGRYNLNRTRLKAYRIPNRHGQITGLPIQARLMIL